MEGTVLHKQSRDANINMAALRLGKVKRLFLVIMIACLFWLMYLLSSLPPKGKESKNHAEVRGDRVQSPSRHFTTHAYRLHNKLDPIKNVLEAPRLPAEQDSGIPEQINKPSDDIQQENSKHAAEAVVLNKSNLGAPVVVGQNKTSGVSAKLSNKTDEVVEKVKNRTLEQLAVIGVNKAPKWLPQLQYVPSKWNLKVSFDDIGDIMKETKFLNKVDPLNLNGPILLSPRNRTANFTYTMPLKFGFCDCYERYCVCCSQITNKRLHLNSTACYNFTFVSKTHELDLRFSLDGHPVHHSPISADKSPLLCLGSIPRVADICVHFFNMTFKVNEHYHHQTQLLGCTDLSLNLYNSTIGAFPVDCFQIPGDPSKAHKEHKFNMMFNWMP